MKILVIYYSFSGNNEALANELRRRLDCDSVRVTEKQKRTSLTILLDLMFRRLPDIEPVQIDLASYDRLVLAGPVWAGRIATPLASFIARHGAQFPEYAFISLCTGGNGQVEKITNELRRRASKNPKAVAQLKVNDLLPPEQQGKIKYTTNHRVSKSDFLIFKRDLDRFLQSL
jgi:flavodoxin